MVYIGTPRVDLTQSTPRVYYTWPVSVAKICKLLKAGVNVTLYAPEYPEDEDIKGAKSQISPVIYASNTIDKITIYWAATYNASSPGAKQLNDNTDGFVETYITAQAQT